MSPGDLNINISKEQADKILDSLPGGRELYEQLADTFVKTLEEGKHEE